LEALAAGLVVVAPDGGGPATYVEQGVTGYLTPTWSTALLAGAMEDALAAVAAETDDARAERSRQVVEEGFTIEAMATALTAVYAEVGSPEGAGDVPASLAGIR
ncbi:MAG: glycosyltransferase, partial [Herbiconiux sp.]|nr:glycosyltransferase [Herbiconiux sp.]